MRITERKREKGHLVRLKFDFGDDALIDLDIADSEGLRENTEISEEKLAQIKETSEYERAKSRALWYLDRADRTEKALYDKLVGARFDPKICARVLEKLVDLGLVDDRRYALNYSQRLFESNTSKRQIYYKLCEKGVPREIAKETVAQLPEDEAAQIRDLIEKKYKNKIKDKESIKKVYASLIRKGFSFGGVRAVLKEYEEELTYTFED
ncbi:MAG: recombination regulator RecX [Clostridia bacterium]|nr:recombination regulator RecX [Clostridia bacterium]